MANSMRDLGPKEQTIMAAITVIDDEAIAILGKMIMFAIEKGFPVKDRTGKISGLFIGSGLAAEQKLGWIA